VHSLHWVQCTCTPRADKKIWGRNLQEKVVCAPPGRAKSHILGHFRWAGEIWRVTTKKVVDVVVNVFEEKVHQRNAYS